MWSTIPTPWRAPSSPARSSSSTSSIRSPFSDTGQPRSNPTTTSSGSSGAPSGRVTRLKTSSRGGSSRSSMAPPSDERPQRLSSIEYAVLARVGDLLLAAHLPAAHRRDDLHGRVERDHGRLDPHLIVALAGAAMGDRVAAGLLGV